MSNKTAAAQTAKERQTLMAKHKKAMHNGMQMTPMTTDRMHATLSQ